VFHQHGGLQGGVRQITAPTAVGTSTVRTAPSVAGNKTGQMCFKNREAIATITLTNDQVAFETHSFVINPGLDVFPLASNLARCFQRYNMRCKFFFETSQPSTSQGQSLIVVNRNVNDPVPNTFSEFSSFMGCVTNPIWTNVECPGRGWIEYNDKFLYTREGPIPDTGDSLMYDYCRVSLGFANIAANLSSNVGTLWCEYEICFDGPKLSSAVQSIIFTTATLAATEEFTPVIGALPANGDPGGVFTQVDYAGGDCPVTYVKDVLGSDVDIFNPGAYSGIVFHTPGYYRIEYFCAYAGGTGAFSTNFLEPYQPENISSESLTLVSEHDLSIPGSVNSYRCFYVNVISPGQLDENGMIVGAGAIIKPNGTTDGATD